MEIQAKRKKMKNEKGDENCSKNGKRNRAVWSVSGSSFILRKDMKISSKISNCMEIQAKRKKKHDEK